MRTRDRRFVTIAPLLALATFVVAGCEPLDGRQPEDDADAARQPSHIDSIHPIEEEIRRFREGVEPVSTLAGGAASRDELVARFIEALQAEDIEALRALAITPAEFAYLYYPHTRFTHPPYELSPALVWFQLENYGGRGLNRALTRYGGRPLHSTGYECPDGPEIEGDNLIWTGCVVRIHHPDEGEERVSLFGAILEREGVAKFVNYGNRL